MKSTDPNCIFCKIVTGQIPDYRVWEDDYFVTFLDIRPITEGHTLIVPKVHIDEVFDLPENIYTGLFDLGRKLAPVIRQVTKCVRVGIALEGFGVLHCHLHLVPLWRGNEMDPNRAHEVSKESLLEMQTKIKVELVKL